MGKGGRSAGEEHPHLGELLSHPQFEPFQQAEFNVAEFTSRVLAGSRTTAQAQSDELRQGVRQLDAALSNYVANHHQELLQHAYKLSDTEHAVQDIMLSVGSLQAPVKRVRAEIEGPYKQIRTKTQQLRNLHNTVELLRQLIHRLKLVQKLRQQMAAPAASLDLAKAAKLLTDINAVSSERDLTGLAAADADEEFLRHTAATIYDQAQVALLEGMESLNQAKVGSALQVFYNLEQLPQAVEALSRQHLSELERSLRQALDSRALSLASAAASAAAGASSSSSGPGGARGLTAPAPGGSAGWQDKLWGGLRTALAQLVAGCVALWHLQRVAAKKKDPLSHVLFLDVLCEPGSPLLTEQYWSSALTVLGDAFTTAAKPAKGAFVREALTSGYPKLVGLLEAAFGRLQAETQVKGVPPFVAPDQLPALLAAAAPFRDAYLAAVLGRLQEGINSAFAGGARGLPTTSDVQKVIGQLHEELKAAGSSSQLGLQIGGVVRKAVRMLAERVEYMAAAGPELRQVVLGPSAGGGASPGQLRNIALCSQLQEVHRSLAALLPRLPPPAASALQGSLGVLQSTAVEMVAPMFKAAVEVFEASICSMHQQQWGPPGGAEVEGGADGAAAAVVEASSYCNVLANAIAQFRLEYLMKFVPQPSPSVPSCISSLCQRTAARLLAFWLRHAALLRPLSQQGKLQLARDLGELQLLISQGVYPLEALGPVHKAARAFRALLFTETAALVDSKAVRELPATLVLLHLFSRLPKEAAAPHERSGLTPLQYSKWLDQHSAKEMLKSVSAALAQAEGASAGWTQQQRDVLGFMQQLCKAASADAAASSS